MSPSCSRAPVADQSVEAAVRQLAAMARLASESYLTLHVVVPRAPGVVERARSLASQAGVTCTVSLRAGTVCARFSPAPVGEER